MAKRPGRKSCNAFFLYLLFAELCVKLFSEAEGKGFREDERQKTMYGFSSPFNSLKFYVIPGIVCKIKMKGK